MFKTDLFKSYSFMLFTYSFLNFYPLKQIGISKQFCKGMKNQSPCIVKKKTRREFYVRV